MLIDEVESLTSARKAAVAGSEPSDAVRAVNALLTQIDNLRSRPNVLIITTSNITEAIDLAFVDRADIKQYIGPPDEIARYEILRSCLNELIRVGIITHDEPIRSYKELQAGNGKHDTQAFMQALQQVARDCDGLSGRALRKMPFIAHAMFVSSITSSMDRFLKALHQAVQKEKTSRQQLGGD